MTDGVRIALITGGFAIVTTLLTLIFHEGRKIHKAVNSRLDAALEKIATLEDAIRDRGGEVPPRNTHVTGSK